MCDLFNTVIPIIGIDVGPNAMTLTLAPQKCADLQQMAGWVNWALNVFPLLHPCLNNFYNKMSGVHNPTRHTWVNNSVHDDLIWAAQHIENSSGVHLLQSTNWDPCLADITAYCDACPEGMGFWYLCSCFPFTNSKGLFSVHHLLF